MCLPPPPHSRTGVVELAGRECDRCIWRRSASASLIFRPLLARLPLAESSAPLRAMRSLSQGRMSCSIEPKHLRRGAGRRAEAVLVEDSRSATMLPLADARGSTLTPTWLTPLKSRVHDYSPSTARRLPSCRTRSRSSDTSVAALVAITLYHCGVILADLIRLAQASSSRTVGGARRCALHTARH